MRQPAEANGTPAAPSPGRTGPTARCRRGGGRHLHPGPEKPRYCSAMFARIGPSQRGCRAATAPRFRGYRLRPAWTEECPPADQPGPVWMCNTAVWNSPSRIVFDTGYVIRLLQFAAGSRPIGSQGSGARGIDAVADIRPPPSRPMPARRARQVRSRRSSTRCHAVQHARHRREIRRPRNRTRSRTSPGLLPSWRWMFGHPDRTRVVG